MIRFRIEFRSGISLHEQLVFAAKKAIVSGVLRPGEPFPSVRALSREFKINPNTAHKVVVTLITDGLIESHPGVGTVVSERGPSTKAEKTQLLVGDIEQLVVDAKRLGISLDDVIDSVSTQWQRLSRSDGQRKTPLKGGRDPE